MKNTSLVLMAVCVTTLALACGDDEGGGPGAAGGTVSELWSGFCTATFTRDVPVKDAFDDPIFTARKGDSYLKASYDTGFGTPDARLLFLSGSGPVDFEVELEEDGSGPFTSNCQIGAGVQHLAVSARAIHHRAAP